MYEQIANMQTKVLERAVDLYSGDSEFPEDWDLKGLNKNLLPIYHKNIIELSDEEVQNLTKEKLLNFLEEEANKRYKEMENYVTPERMREVERVVMLKIIDSKWIAHLDDMERIRQGINLRAYAQKDPLTEYKFISFDMFEELSMNIQNEVVKSLYNIKFTVRPNMEEKRERVDKETFTNKEEAKVNNTKTQTRSIPKVGRNELCPCGSGKKYKQCHGK